MQNGKGIYYAGGAALGVALLALMAWRQAPVQASTILIEPVEFAITLRAEGELKAVRSRTVAAPMVQGRMQIIQLIRAGSQVEPGDVLVQFDPTEKQKARDDAQFDIRAAEEEITKTEASLDAELAQLRTEIKKAEIEAKTAELDLGKNEILSRIEADKNRLKVEQAEFTLERLKERVAAKRRQADAELKSLEVKRQKAVAARALAERDLDRMTLKAPIAGLVVYRQMWKGDGMDDPQEGDTVWPGWAILELPDLTELQVSAFVHESDGGLLAEGQAAKVRMDAFADMEFDARVEQISSLARRRRGRGNNPAKYFTITLALESTEPSMRPGMTTSVDVIIDTVPNALTVPIEAVFEREGEPAVYVRRGRGFDLRQVKLGKRNATHVVIEDGLDSGEEIALRDPNEAMPATESSQPGGPGIG